MGGAFILGSDIMNTEPKPRARCAACGEDLQQIGGKPVRLVSLPAEVRWQEAPTPQAALALVKKARAQGVSQTERVLCCRCARHAASSGDWIVVR
jgi:hypothetical protein